MSKAALATLLLLKRRVMLQLFTTEVIAELFVEYMITKQLAY